MQYSLWEQGLRKLDLFNLEKKRLREGLYSAYIFLMGSYRKD